MLREDTTDDDALSLKFVRSVRYLLGRKLHLQAVLTQTVHYLKVRRIVEVGNDTLCYHLAYSIYIHQLLQRSVLQRIHRLEMARQQSG